jgi:serpin B
MKTSPLYSLLTLLTILSLALAACGTTPPPSTSAPAATSGPAPKSNLLREKPSVQAGDLRPLTDGNNAFAFDLYQSLRAGNDNLAYSPFSISLALAMTSAGARGGTAEQMTRVLHFLPQDQLHPAFNALDQALEAMPSSSDKDQEPLQLSVANAVWAEQSLPLQSDFLDTLALNYGAGIHQSDFINQAEAVRNEINTWVSDKTQEKIQDILPENAIGPATRMALVNAIYFKADWLDPFDAGNTFDQPFHLLDGSEVNVPMMGQGMDLPYAAGDGWQMVELPYAGGSAAMDILVPDEGRFEEIETSLDFEAASAMWNGLQPNSVSLALPKFKVESSFMLADQLATLGMTDAFSPDLADFSGMTGNKDLYIGMVIHKAFVAVDEEGTEAAAATIAVMELTMAQAFDVTLRVDRPFIYIIRDLQSGQILFMGRVLNPAQ